MEHYNYLSPLQKLEQCKYWSVELEFIQPKNFSSAHHRHIKTKFENAKKLKSRYKDASLYGYIGKIDSHLNYKSLTHEQLANFIYPNLFTAENIRVAEALKEVYDFDIPTSEKKNWINQINEKIETINELVDLCWSYKEEIHNLKEEKNESMINLYNVKKYLNLNEDEVNKVIQEHPFNKLPWKGRED